MARILRGGPVRCSRPACGQPGTNLAHVRDCPPSCQERANRSTGTLAAVDERTRDVPTARRTLAARAHSCRRLGYRPAAMRVGVAREIKPQEYRVALTPAGALELRGRGHDVLVETGAGEGSGFPDDAYRAVGARIVDVEEVWAEAELLLKVKEPVAAEYGRLRENLVLFTYLHVAADEPLTRALLDSGVAAVAYETVETADRRLPLLAPMSEVAGRLAPQAAAWALEKAHGGRGILLGGVPGVPPAK